MLYVIQLYHYLVKNEKNLFYSDWVFSPSFFWSSPFIRYSLDLWIIRVSFYFWVTFNTSQRVSMIWILVSGFVSTSKYRMKKPLITLMSMTWLWGWWDLLEFSLSYLALRSSYSSCRIPYYLVFWTTLEFSCFLACCNSSLNSSFFSFNFWFSSEVDYVYFCSDSKASSRDCMVEDCYWFFSMRRLIY